MSDARAWAGSIILGDGWALVDARVGASRPHSHLAHQLCLATEADIDIAGEEPLLVPRGRAAFIPAGLSHRIGPAGAATRSFYIDATFWRRGRARPANRLSLRPSREAKSLGAIRDADTGRAFARELTGNALPSSPDARLAAALSRAGPDASPLALARASGLSPSHLRELAIRDYGVSPSKLLQWRQIVRAVAAVGEGCGLAEAAAAGGFADQSHFTRRCVQWLGVTPSSGLASLHPVPGA
ncbi:MAG: helix-turn-helix domain-containing protein [Sphingopyxis sp.]|nr:helix-turn-helix domain-containing protein [Sphingopyxis sp.]